MIKKNEYGGGGCCLTIVTLLSHGKEVWLNSFTSFEVAS